MKVCELVKQIEVSIEIPQFETYTNPESVSKTLSVISDAKSKMEFIKNSISVLERFHIDIGYYSMSFAVNVYSNRILFSFNRDWVIGKIPVNTSKDVDIAALQREKWEEISNKERVRFALDCHISYLEELQTKYEEWMNFLESEVDVQ